MPVSLTLFLAAMAASLMVSLVGLFAALREPGLRFRLLWAVTALVGVGGGVVSWQAPHVVYWFFGIALPTISYSAVPGGWEPQYLRVFFPLSALVVLLRISRCRGKRAKSKLVGFSVG